MSLDFDKKLEWTLISTILAFKYDFYAFLAYKTSFM